MTEGRVGVLITGASRGIGKSIALLFAKETAITEPVLIFFVFVLFCFCFVLFCFVLFCFVSSSTFID